MAGFDGLVVGLDQLHRLSDAQSRSLSAENPTGGKGQGGREPASATGSARDLGLGWKCRPSVKIEPGETCELANIAGSGAIQRIWMTPAGISNRLAILRAWWDDQEQPSVECPLADFFASAYVHRDIYVPLNSLAVCVNPGSAYNCYWPMPFRKRCRMTVQNLADKPLALFYQIDYALGPVGSDAAYFHAQFRRVNPLPYKQVYTILDGVKGKGHYVGTYLAWQVNNKGWWGEGEIKFYLDGDRKPGQQVAEHGGDAFPTICGTGTEDYFCGSYNFENRETRSYQPFCTPYAGMPHVVRPDGTYDSQTRFSLYRWHLTDPIRFQQDLSVTIQALGWRMGGRYLPLQDDIASVAFWYQSLPTAPFPALPGVDDLEII